MVKSYRPPRELLGEVQQTLAARKLQSPLESVVDIVSRGRHYAWTAIYLAASNPAPLQEFREGPPHGTTVRFPIHAGQRVLGVMEVTPGQRGLGPTDRIFLRELAKQLARFMSGRGKYLLRQARESAATHDEQAHAMRYPPGSEKPAQSKRAAAGEARR